MKNKKIIFIALIIILLTSCIILISSQNNTDDYNPGNNTTESNISNDTIKNSSFNTNQITKSAKNVVSRINNNQTIESGEKRNDTNKIINFNKKSVNGVSPSNNSNSDSLEITPEDIKKRVERSVVWRDYGRDVNIGEPYKYYNYSETVIGWLVPAFDKNTGEFIGSVNVLSNIYKRNNGEFGVMFSHGTDSYSVYLDVISGKPFPNPEPIGNITQGNVGIITPNNIALSSDSNSSDFDAFPELMESDNDLINSSCN